MQLTKRSRESTVASAGFYFIFSFSLQDAPTPSSVIHENFENMFLLFCMQNRITSGC